MLLSHPLQPKTFSRRFLAGVTFSVFPPIYSHFGYIFMSLLFDDSQFVHKRLVKGVGHF